MLERDETVNPYKYVKDTPYRLYINGEFVPSQSGETIELINPVNNEKFATVYKGGKAEVEKAIVAARDAFDRGPWGRMTNYQRSKLLLKAHELMAERLEELAALEALNGGKIYSGCLHYDAVKGLDGLQYSAGQARCLEGKVIPVDGGGRFLNYVIWQPRGVVAEILPWNCPLMMGTINAAAALAAGNTVIIKPSSWTPLSMLVMAEIFHEAGFPPGVVNIITGSGADVGSALVESPRVDFISLTGGTETGREIIAQSSATIKDIALELGGKSPNIIFPDIQWEAAVKWARSAFTMSSGQICVAGTRLILHRSIYDEFLENLKAECEKLVPGDGFHGDKGVNLPPLIHKDHAARVWGYIEKAKAEGARLITGGVPYSDPVLAKGNFVPPTIFADVTPEMTVFREEIFGPVLAVTPFDTEREAIDLANNTPFGLAGAVFTNDGRRALRVAEAIHAGQIYVNTYFSKGIVESPGIGWKDSGLGAGGIQRYMRQKTIFVDINEEIITPP